MNTPNPPDNYEILPADFLREHGVPEGLQFTYPGMPRWLKAGANIGAKFHESALSFNTYCAPVGTMARVLPVAPASETPETDASLKAVAAGLQRTVTALERRLADSEARVKALEYERATSIEHTGKLLAASEAGAAALREALSPFAEFACELAIGEVCECGNCEAKAALATDAGAATLKRIELLEAANGAVERIAMERNQFEKEAKDARAKLAEAERERDEWRKLCCENVDLVQSLKEDLTAARALADRMGEDNARLDWLECNLSLIRYTSPDMSNKNWLATLQHQDKPTERVRFLTMREAIDAAIAAREEAK